MITISQPIPADSSIVINRDQKDFAPDMGDEERADPPQKTAFVEEEEDVPGPGLEPGSPFRAGDFKSPVSTNSTTPADCRARLGATGGDDRIRTGE